MLDNTLSQNLNSVSQTLVKKYSYSYYSKASGVVVSFYLRGGRFPWREALETLEMTSRQMNGLPIKPVSLTPHVVPVPAPVMKASVLPQVPSTPVRSPNSVASWGSASSTWTTPGLVSSDSMSSSPLGMEVDDDAAYSSSSVYASSDDYEVDIEVTSADDDDSEYEMDAVQSATAGALGLTIHPDNSESMPVTPITPFFNMNPFENVQAAAIVAAVAQKEPSGHSRDKENLVPHGHLPAHNNAHAPCNRVNMPNVLGVVENGAGEDMSMMTGEYRPALLAIVNP